jgi:hypothetical protein
MRSLRTILRSFLIEGIPEHGRFTDFGGIRRKSQAWLSDFNEIQDSQTSGEMAEGSGPHLLSLDSVLENSSEEWRRSGFQFNPLMLKQKDHIRREDHDNFAKETS